MTCIILHLHHKGRRGGSSVWAYIYEIPVILLWIFDSSGFILEQGRPPIDSRFNETYVTS